jgi:hypothetical protein
MKKILILVLLFGGWAVSGFSPLLWAQPLDPNESHVSAISDEFTLCSLSYGVSRDQTLAQQYVTTSGYLAAVEEELLDRAIFWAGVGNEQEFMRFVTSTDLVFPLKSGLRVHIEKFSFSGKVKIRPEGSTISVWTVREALRSEPPSNGT